jgi:hypothetical protein
MTLVDLVKASVDPLHHTCAPPVVNPTNTFLKRFDGVGDFVVDDSALVDEQVSTGTGAVIWWPHHGGGSLYRFGIVPAGTVLDAFYLPPNTNYTSGAPYVPGVFLVPEFQSGPAFRYFSPTMLPYDVTQTNNVLNVSPQLQPDLQSSVFSQVRVIEGCVSLTCDTVPIGNTALNGFLSVSAIGDIRDVLQVGYVSASVSNFTVVSGTTLDPPTLVQAAVTSKDGVKEISGMQGVYAVLGPDIASVMGPPDADQTDMPYYGAPLQGPISPAFFNPAGNQPNPVFPGEHTLQFTMWVTPWNTAYTDTPLSPFNVNYGPIDPFSVLDIHFDFQIMTQGTQPIGFAETWTLEATHVFAAIGSNGSVDYNSLRDTYNMCTVGNNASGVYNVGCSFDITPKWYQGNMTGQSNGSYGLVPPNTLGATLPCNGMYLGSSYQIHSQNNTSVEGNNVQGDYISYGWYSVKPRNLYQSGGIGPCRVLKYDGFTNNQLLKCSAQYTCECIPGLLTAPFVQSTGQNVPRCMDVSSLPYLAELYNCDSPFARVYAGRDYQEVLDKLKYLDMRLLEEWVPRWHFVPPPTDMFTEDAEPEELSYSKLRRMR